MSEAKKVIFITGADYSGTSLLSEMLSTHEHALFAGEMQHCRFQEKRICQTCGLNCAIWKDFVWHSNESAHEAIAQRSNTSIIIDSTKKPVSWIAEQSALLTEFEIPWVLILLMRDPRSVIVQCLKNQPETSLEQHARSWYREAGAREKLFRNLTHVGNTFRLRYEDLVTKPEEILQAICKSIELPFHEDMLYPGKAHQHRLVNKTSEVKTVKEFTPVSVHMLEKVQKGFGTAFQKQVEEVTGVLFPLYKWEP